MEIQKIRMYFPQTLRVHSGENMYYLKMNKQWSGQKQECTSTQTPCYAWENSTVQKMQQEGGMIKCQLWRCVLPSRIRWRSDWLRVEKFSQEPKHWIFSTKFKQAYKERTPDPEQFSDRIIFMSTFNGIALERKDNRRFLCSYLKEDKTICLQHSTMDIGHSWGPEKKASGIKDMQPNMVASGIFVRHKWWKTSRIQDIWYSRSVSPLGRGILKKRNNRETILFNGKYGNINLPVQDCSCREPVLYLRGSLKGVWTEFRRSKPKQTRMRSQDVPRNSNETGRSQVIGGYSKTTACIGNTECSSIWRISIRYHLWAKLKISVQRRKSTIRSRKESHWCHNYSWWWRMEKTHFDVQRIYSAQQTERIPKPSASTGAGKEIGPVLNIEITSNIDVLGIEVQVPSLSSPGYSVWILIRCSHERFVNEIHRHNSDILNYSSSLPRKEDNFSMMCVWNLQNLPW